MSISTEKEYNTRSGLKVELCDFSTLISKPVVVGYVLDSNGKVPTIWSKNTGKCVYRKQFLEPYDLIEVKKEQEVVDMNVDITKEYTNIQGRKPTLLAYLPEYSTTYGEDIECLALYKDVVIGQIVASFGGAIVVWDRKTGKTLFPIYYRNDYDLIPVEAPTQKEPDKYDLNLDDYLMVWDTEDMQLGAYFSHVDSEGYINVFNFGYKLTDVEDRIKRLENTFKMPINTIPRVVRFKHYKKLGI